MTFSWDDSAKTFLEKQLPATDANRIMRDDVRIWKWRCRFFVPAQHVEHSVDVSPEGTVTGYAWTLPEDDTGARLERDSALALVEPLLHAESGARSSWRLVEANSSVEKNRVDWDFTWEKIGWDADSATWRRTISIAGDRIKRFGDFLKIPEEWSRNEEKHQAPRSVLATTASAFDALLQGALVVAFIVVLTRKSGIGRFAFACGGILAALTLITSVNGYPLIWSDYRTTEEFQSFIVDWLGRIPIGAVAALTGGAFLAYTTEAVARSAFPHHPPLALAVRKEFWRSRETFHAILAGYGLGFVHLGYVTLFYILGRFAGIWSPMQIPSSETAATLLPGIYPVITGFFPAFNEEFTYRLFAVSLLFIWVNRVFIARPSPLLDVLARIFKRPWMAILAPGMLWAFLHVNYPQEPFYIRGLELTVIGILYGIIFVRHGIVASFVAHYTVNAVLSSTLLLRAEHPYLRASGIAASLLMLIPALPGAWSLLRGRRLLEPKELRALVESEPATTSVPIAHPAAPRYIYRPFSRRALIGLGAVIASSIIFPLLPASDERPPIAVRTTREEAAAIADAWLSERGEKPASWKRSTAFFHANGGSGRTYAWETQGESGLAIIDAAPLIGPYWRVRYCRPLEKEEYALSIGQDDKIFSVQHGLDEAAPGAKLSEGAARALAEFLLVKHGFDTPLLRLVDHSAEERPARTDHTFTWESDSWIVGDAHLRLNIQVRGDEAGQYAAWFKVPETWERERSRRELKDSISGAISAGLGFALLFFLVGFFFRGLTQGGVAWRSVLALALLPLLALPFSWLNSAPSFWSRYSTSQPMPAFLAIHALMLALSLVGLYLAGVLTFASAGTHLRRAFPGYPTVADWLRGCVKVEGANKCDENGARTAAAVLWRDAIIGALAALATGAWFGRLISALERALRPLFHSFSPGAAPTSRILGGYEDLSPILEIPSLVSQTIFVLVGIAMAAAFWRQEARRRRIWLGLVLIFLILSAVTDARSLAAFPAELIRSAGTLMLFVLLTVIVVRKFLRDHAGAYLLALLILFTGKEFLSFARIPDPSFRMHAALYATLIVIMIGYALLRSRGGWEIFGTDAPLSNPDEPDSGVSQPFR